MKGTQKKATYAVLAAFALVVPGAAFAVTTLSGLLDMIYGFVNALIPFVIALAVLWFIFGVFQYVTAGDDAEKQKSGRGKIIWGIVAIAVMVSVWGLVGLLTNQLSLSNAPGTAPTTPPVHFPNP
jgi:hypothetical protein